MNDSQAGLLARGSRSPGSDFPAASSLPRPHETEWRVGAASHLQWRDRAGISPDFPVMPNYGHLQVRMRRRLSRGKPTTPQAYSSRTTGVNETATGRPRPGADSPRHGRLASAVPERSACMFPAPTIGVACIVLPWTLLSWPISLLFSSLSSEPSWPGGAPACDGFTSPRWSTAC